MDMRIVQLTPPGSACAERRGRGVEVSGVDDMGGVKYAYFADPEGNSWALQEIPASMHP